MRQIPNALVIVAILACVVTLERRAVTTWVGNFALQLWSAGHTGPVSPDQILVTRKIVSARAPLILWSRYDKPAYSRGLAGMTESWNGQTLRRNVVYNSLSSYPLSSILYFIDMRIPATQFRRFIFRRRKLSSIRAVALVVSCVALAFLVRFLLTPFTVADSAFATFYPAILFSALVGGTVAGVAAIILSFLAGWWAFLEPIYVFNQPNFREIVHLGLFILSSGVIVWLALQYRRTVFELEDSESQRRLLADEVRHRAKNTVSVILAIVAQTINDKELAHTLSDRIRASVDARDPLETDPSQSTDLRELLVDTVQRTHGQNIVLNGPAVRLGEAQARNLRFFTRCPPTRPSTAHSRSRRGKST